MSTFEDIYRGNLWNGTETRSGPGSGTIATRPIIRPILDIVAELGVGSVLDLGCGECFWQPELPGYLGLDVSPYAIRSARTRHPGRRFEVWNVADPLPDADLVMVRDVLQHLSAETVGLILARIRETAAGWLLASTYEDGSNEGMTDGGFARPDLTAYPFGLADPEVLIPDGYGYHEPTHVRDAGKMLGLWRLS